MIIVVLVALGDAGDPSTQSLTAAAQEGLGNTALIVVREAPIESLQEHASSEKTGALLHADAVATVVWEDPSHLHAHVSVYSSHDHDWQDRSVSFAGADAPTERGRQIGFGIAAMVPPPDATPPPSPYPPNGPYALPKPAPHEDRIAIDLVGSGASGTAGGVGGELSARWRAWKSLWFRAGIGMRFGTIGDADSSFFDVRFDGGPVVTILSVSPFELAVRSDFVATRIAVSRSTSAVNGTGSHFVTGADLLVEGAYGLTRGFALVVAAGAQLDFGTTRIIVDGAEVDRAPQLRAVGEIGVRVRF